MLLFIELLCKHGVVALCQPWLNDSVVCCGGASWVTVTTVSAPGGKQHTQRQQRDHLADEPGMHVAFYRAVMQAWCGSAVSAVAE
jgi:hypothetical protein